MIAGWREAITSLFVAHRRHLESIVRKSVGSRETAAEIVQDVFARAIASGPRASVDDDRRVLFASARNAAVEHYRGERRRDRLAAALLSEHEAGITPSAEAGLEARQALSALDVALHGLSPRCRDIFLMRRVDGLPNAEIARRHGISVNSVEKHIARALRHCQVCLAGHLGPA